MNAFVIRALLFVFVLLGTAVWSSCAEEDDNGQSAMEAMDGDVSAPSVPPVKGFTEGEEIRFLHTEASDAQVANMLTMMMDSPVVVVPSLAQAPETMLANVYVFANGVQGEGPFGFQADVFDNPPSAEGYSPLRRLNKVTWKRGDAARTLKSVEDVFAAEEQGEVVIERPGVVINMPMVTWPGGSR